MRLCNSHWNDCSIRADGRIRDINVHLKIKCHDSHLFLNYTSDHHYSADDPDRWSQAQSRQVGIQYSVGSRYGYVDIVSDNPSRDNDCHDIEYLKACFTFI